jgi:hypothetical protein
MRLMRRVQKKDPSQQSITGLFAKKEVVRPVIELTTPKLASGNPIVQKYYSSLSEKEQRAHVIAMEKLGTSYDVVRTHGFLVWQKAQQSFE